MSSNNGSNFSDTNIEKKLRRFSTNVGIKDVRGIGSMKVGGQDLGFANKFPNALKGIKEHDDENVPSVGSIS